MNNHNLKRYNFLLALAVFSLLSMTATCAKAAVVLENDFSITKVEGLVATSSIELDKMSLILPAQNYATSTKVKLSIIDEPIADLKDARPISQMYQVEFSQKAIKNYTLNLGFDTKNSFYKKIFYYDGVTKSWKPLSTVENFSEKTVSTVLAFPFVRLAVFEYSNVLMSGKASWYSYKKGLFAASPDFAFGTRLKVTSLTNPDKSVVVTVNDFGPNRVLHPDRVIDLDKVAFAALADIGAGVIGVRIEPLNAISSLVVKSETAKKVESVVVSDEATTEKLISTTTDALGLSSKSAVVVSAKTGKVLYAKDENLQLPLASLSKLVAMKVYLDTKPDLNKIITYKTQDEDYNYQYAERGTLAKLRVSDGETMTARDLLYSSVLGSANNAVESLVRSSGLTRKAFIARMNKYVKSLGTKQTSFVEPTGLSPENVSSTYDYALITRAVLADGNLEKVSKTKGYSFTTINKKKAHYIKNTNKLFFTSDLQITGSKTGYLDEAQYCLVTRAKDTSGRQVIAITFGTPDKYSSFKETEKLLYYGLKKLN